jgi:hypothetical protein
MMGQHKGSISFKKAILHTVEWEKPHHLQTRLKGIVYKIPTIHWNHQNTLIISLDYPFKSEAFCHALSSALRVYDQHESRISLFLTGKFYALTLCLFQERGIQSKWRKSAEATS